VIILGVTERGASFASKAPSRSIEIRCERSTHAPTPGTVRSASSCVTIPVASCSACVWRALPTYSHAAGSGISGLEVAMEKGDGLGEEAVGGLTLILLPILPYMDV